MQQAGNTCGVHVILNAWADILKLQISSSARPHAKFYDEAKLLINRAMAGKTTTREIQAWLYSSKYVVGSYEARNGQVAADPELAAMMQARTAPMNDRRLGEYLDSEDV
ncbi:MAG: hypothetical protein Q9191_003791, partial [Dirinaria sp. TL-2023a]